MGITLLPTLNLLTVNPNLLAEKYLYLPSIGFCLLLAYIIEQIYLSFSARHPVYLLYPLLMLTFLGLSLITFSRALSWKNEIILLQHDTRQTPHAVLFHQLGIAYQSSSDYQSAVKSYQEALVLAPQFSYPALNLGYLAENSGATPAARSWYLKATQGEPLSADAWNNLGVLDLKIDQLDSAAANFRQALVIDPQHQLSRQALTRLTQRQVD
jgi:tetratricopeptide (TPR) repeat protein